VALRKAQKKVIEKYREIKLTKKEILDANPCSVWVVYLDVIFGRAKTLTVWEILRRVWEYSHSAKKQKAFFKIASGAVRQEAFDNSPFLETDTGNWDRKIVFKPNPRAKDIRDFVEQMVATAMVWVSNHKTVCTFFSEEDDEQLDDGYIDYDDVTYRILQGAFGKVEISK
jgi:hypothetical protein